MRSNELKTGLCNLLEQGELGRVSMAFSRERLQPQNVTMLPIDIAFDRATLPPLRWADCMINFCFTKLKFEHVCEVWYSEPLHVGTIRGMVQKLVVISITSHPPAPFYDTDANCTREYDARATKDGRGDVTLAHCQVLFSKRHLST